MQQLLLKEKLVKQTLLSFISNQFFEMALMPPMYTNYYQKPNPEKKAMWTLNTKIEPGTEQVNI